MLLVRNCQSQCAGASIAATRGHCPCPRRHLCRLGPLSGDDAEQSCSHPPRAGGVRPGVTSWLMTHVAAGGPYKGPESCFPSSAAAGGSGQSSVKCFASGRGGLSRHSVDSGCNQGLARLPTGQPDRHPGCETNLLMRVVHTGRLYAPLRKFLLEFVAGGLLLTACPLPGPLYPYKSCVDGGCLGEIPSPPVPCAQGQVY